MATKKRRLVVLVMLTLFCAYLVRGFTKNTAETRTFHSYKLQNGLTNYTNTIKLPKTFSKFIDVYDMRHVRYDDDLRCLPLTVPPHVPVCVYDTPGEDVVEPVSVHLKNTGVFKPTVTALLYRLLAENEDIGMIDVGAGLGYFSLLAAALGRPSIVVEPVAENLRRLVRAARLAETRDSLLVLHNAVSNHHEVRPLHFQLNKPGHATLEGAYQLCKKKRGGCAIVRTVYLDELAPLVSSKTTILRLYVSGYEIRALKKASKLFEEVNIQYVLMKWGPFCKDSGKTLTAFFLSRNYRPFTASFAETDVTKCENDDILWVKDKDTNVKVEVM